MHLEQKFSKSIHTTKCTMNFALIFFAFWSVFISSCHSLTVKSSENSGISSRDTECMPDHCSTVILSQDDYLFLPDDTLFVRPLSLTIDSSSYVTSNGTVAVCECLFYRLEKSESQHESCNLTIDDCTTVKLDPRDILHLSDGAVFVKPLNTRLNDSRYEVANESVVACECLTQDRELSAFFNKTCNFTADERASMSTNCSTLTLRPRDYRFLPNATLYVFAWNETLNDSFFSVENGSVNVCAPECGTEGGGRANRPLQILCSFLGVFVFELFVSCGYCAYPTLVSNRAKCKIATFLYIASALMTLLHLIYFKVGIYDNFEVLYYEVSFLAVVEFGMLSTMSSDMILKFLERIGAFDSAVNDWNARNISPDKPMRMKIFYWCCLIMPFAIAGSFRSQELSSGTYANKIPTSDYYYSKQFRESVPLFFLYDVVLVFATGNLTIFMVSFFWYWRRVSNPNDQQVFLRMTYMLHMTFFTIATLFWIVGNSILIEDELYKPLWPLFLTVNLFLSSCISWFVFREDTLNAIIQFFVIQ